MVQLRTLIGLGATLGGLCWVAAYALHRGDTADGLVSLLFWAGLVLMTVAFLGAGIDLVRVGNHWLEIVVGVATPALVWSVVWAFRSGGTDPYVVDGVFGVLAVLFGVATMARRPRAAEAAELRPGRRRAA